MSTLGGIRKAEGIKVRAVVVVVVVAMREAYFPFHIAASAAGSLSRPKLLCRKFVRTATSAELTLAVV